MLSALKFVQGAVSRKDFVPELTHFRIKEGRVTGFNGKMVISSPIDLDIDCCPKAIPFVKAIEACNAETAQLHLTATGKLSIRSGTFRTHVETMPEVFSGVEPEGEFVAVDGQLLPALAQLHTFSGEDASRPWAMGVLLDGSSAFATNNVILAERWLGYHFPYRINLPRYALKEILRIKEEPTQLQVNQNNATFHYEGGRWLRTQLNSIEWPDIQKMFGEMPPASHGIPERFFEALTTLAPFTDEAGRVFLKEGELSTVAREEDQGTAITLPQVNYMRGIFNVDMLRLLEGAAQTLGFEEYPRPCAWYGDRIRGLIVGMRP